MKLGGLLQGMRQRVPWSVAGRILKELDLPRGQGWERTVERLMDGNYKKQAILDALEMALIEHIIYGEKLVRVYDLAKGEKESLIKDLENVKTPETNFSKNFPQALAPEELATGSPIPTLVSVQERNDSICAVFGSVRTMQSREPVSMEEMPEGSRGIFERFDEVVGIKHIKYEAFDIVLVSRHSPRVIVLVDHPDGAPKENGLGIHLVVPRQLTEIVEYDYFTKPVNLFPLINAMYKTKGEGNVVELAFGTTTASLKHEKMRRQNTCLRDETYHKGGKAALRTQIEPHRLSINWKRALPSGASSIPELSLNTTSATAASPHPALFEAEIRRCMGADDFSFVQSKLEHFISQRSKR